MPMRFVDRYVRSLAAACLLAAVPVAAQQPAVQAPAFVSPACRERTRQFDLIAATADALQLNMALFGAADAGCEPLASRLIGAGASLAARDRLGAMPLAHAARAGHLALV